MRATPRERARSVKVCAGSLGFDACGIATAGAIDPDDRLGAWLSNGYHADMAWLARTRDVRQDITLKLPGVKSVVVVAKNYYVARTHDGSPRTHGKVARYAWGRDYHRVLRKPLRALAHHIESMETGATTYSGIDSAPILERAWAQRAGIGWIGKNALVLRRDLGSWFLLAVVATTVELGPDRPAADHCGTCRACIDACPTAAIVEPRVVDSRRCISYQTIENRGTIPDAVAQRIEGWIFGCDICQDVCPWNKKAPDTDLSDFFPRPGQPELELDAIQEMDEEAFRARFAGTPLMRAKLKGLQRNAGVLRGETGRGPS